MNKSMGQEGSERSALVTGGSGDIGGAIVRRLCADGVVVRFTYSSSVAHAEKLARETGAVAIRADLRKRRIVIEDLDKVDILVNCAGVNLSSGLTTEVAWSDWTNMLRINLEASVLLSRGCLPGMVKRRWGRIINVSSIYGLRGSVRNLGYTASKHALSGVMKTIAREYAEHGITCNEVCPGPVNGNLMRTIAAKKASATGQTEESYLGAIAASIPSRRLAEPSDVGAVVAFLASDDASYVNGVSIPVDGGLTC